MQAHAAEDDLVFLAIYSPRLQLDNHVDCDELVPDAN